MTLTLQYADALGTSGAIWQTQAATPIVEQAYFAMTNVLSFRLVDNFIVIIRAGESADFLAEDDKAITWGVGDTQDYAVEDWRSSLSEHYTLLRDTRQNLSPRLKKELNAIESKLSVDSIANYAAA